MKRGEWRVSASMHDGDDQGVPGLQLGTSVNRNGGATGNGVVGQLATRYSDAKLERLGQRSNGQEPQRSHGRTHVLPVQVEPLFLPL